MSKLLTAAFALLTALVFSPPASAQSAPWRVVEISGAARVTAPGTDAADLRADMAVSPGSTITTGVHARVTLSNGAQRMLVTANSRITIAQDSTDLMTRIMQDLGAVLFQVDRRDQQHFRVETPLLAAVVKGTTFTISVGAGEDRVHVAEGLVEVAPAHGGAPRDVAAGISVRVAQASPVSVDILAASNSQDPNNIEPDVLDYESSTQGLVANGPGASQAQGRWGEHTRGDTGETGADLRSSPMSAPPGLAIARAQTQNRNDAGPPITPPGQGGGAGNGPPITPPGQGGGAGNGPPITPPGQGGGAGNGPPITPPGQGGGPPANPPDGRP